MLSISYDSYKVSKKSGMAYIFGYIVYPYSKLKHHEFKRLSRTLKKMGCKGKVSILSQRTENRFDLMYANGDIDEIDNILAKRQTGHGGVFFRQSIFSNS